MPIKPLATTAIGSVPFDRVETALDGMAGLDIPANPQMVKISCWEDMLLGAVAGLPALIVDGSARTVKARRDGRENELADFYAQFMTQNYDFLALPEESSRGFRGLLERARQDPGYGPDFLKSQLIGPLTFSQMVLLEDGEKTMVDDPELLEAAAQALGGKAAWEAAQIRATGRTPIIFIDEPGLASYGSAFCGLTEETVVKTLGASCEVVRTQEGPALLGCHICGNTDWGMMTRTGLDILNFDAFNFLEAFSLYPRELKAFLEQGGRVAWGIVPADGFHLGLTADFLARKLHQGWLALDKKGLDYQLLRERAIITTACGLSTLPEDLAAAALSMLPQVSAILADLNGGR